LSGPWPSRERWRVEVVEDVGVTATVLSEEAAAPSFVRATSHLLMGGVGAHILVAATFALVARDLGPAIFGLMVALLGIAAVCQDLLDFGTSQWMIREIAAGRLSIAGARGVLRRRTRAVALICGLAAGLCIFAGAPALRTAATATYVIAAVANAGMYARLRGTGNFRRAAMHAVGERLALLLWVLVLVVVAPSREVAVAALIGGTGFLNWASTLAAPRALTRSRASYGLPLRSMYRDSRAFGLLGLSVDLQQLDAAATAPLAGVGVAATVGVASKLTAPAGVLAGAVSQVAFRGVAAGGVEAGRSARLAIKLSVALALLFALAAPLLPLIAVGVLGGEYRAARTAILVYAVGTTLAMVAQPLTSILAAGGHDRLVSRITAAAVVAGLLVGVSTVQSAGAPGMGLGFVITQLLILAACGFVHQRNLRTESA
jgi:O-antigen/teichoic acid export membrane protein